MWHSWLTNSILSLLAYFLSFMSITELWNLPQTLMVQNHVCRINHYFIGENSLNKNLLFFTYLETTTTKPFSTALNCRFKTLPSQIMFCLHFLFPDENVHLLLKIFHWRSFDHMANQFKFGWKKPCSTDNNNSNYSHNNDNNVGIYVFLHDKP